MKKFALRFISLLLIFAMLVPVLASCADEAKTLSEASDENFSIDSDATPSDAPPKDDCALGRHSWKLIDTVQKSDCEHDGILMYGCDCGEFYLQLQKTDGHSFGEWYTYSDATCYAMGETFHTCELCDHTEYKPLAKIDHTYTVSDGEDGQTVYECSVCYDSFTVDSALVSNTFSSESQHLWDCAEDFSFVILSQCEDYEIRDHLRIIDQYYEGSDEEFSEIASVEYTLTKLSDGVWRVTPEGSFVPGTTYKAIRSGDVVFRDYGVQDLSFSIEKEETNIVEFQNGIVFLQALQNASGGYYPYKTDYSESSGLCYLTLRKVGGLHLGDVLCVGPATSADDILGNSSKNIFGKIEKITKIEQTDEFLVQLSKPSASELFDKLDIYSSKATLLENVEVNESVLDQVSASLYESEDFVKLLSVTYTTALEYLSAKGLSTKLTSVQEFLEKLVINFDPFKYIEATSEIKAEISFEGEASIPVTLTSDKNSENIGSVNLNFSSYLTLIFTPHVYFDNIKNFDFHITQEILAGLTFHVETNVEYTATDKPYVLNTDSNVYHYKNCKHVPQIKDTSKIQRISTAELLQKVSDKNIATIECGSCQPIQSMLATMYVINPTSGVFHVVSCYSAKAINDPLFTERSASALLSDDYTPCGNCHPESVKHNGFEEKLLKKIASEDFGAHLDEVKEFADGLQSNTDGVAKNLLYATFSIYGVGTVEVSLGVYVDFKLKASLNYEMDFQHSIVYGVQRTKEAGIQPYGKIITGADDCFTKNHLTISGKTRVDVGIISKITLSLLGNRAFAVASADLDLKTGVYAKLHGALQLDLVNPNENYIAGYFEAGLHCTVTVSASVFEMYILNPKNLYKEDFPFLTLGYEKVYYNFVEIPDEVILTKKPTDIAQKGLLHVKYYDLKKMETGKEHLSSLLPSTHYRVELSLGKGEFCYIENGKIVIKDDAKDFTDTLTIRVVGLDTWSENDPNNCLVSLPEYTVTIRYERPYGTEGLEYTLLDDGTYEVSVGTATDVAEIVIPETYEGIAVTRIADEGFRVCYELRQVTIPNSITSIGSYAFLYCQNLTSIVIPSSIVSIEESAFSGCYGLTSVTIGNGVTVIGNKAFHDCGSLTSVTIGNNVISIGNEAFSGCYSLISVMIPSSVTSIGNDAFWNCNSLTSVTLGNGVTSIGNHAFSYCKSLTSIVIPDSVQSIGSYAFWYCTDLTSIVISDSVRSIAEHAFSCTAYYDNESNWQNDVLYIGNHLIRVQNSISGAYTIKDGTKTIAESSFYNCYDLTSITIPNSVTSIGGSAFYACNNLESTMIPSSITSIGEYAFYACSSLESIMIPSNITSIGEGAFSNCESLTSITLPDGVTSIGANAFSACSSLTSITIPDSVTSIGNEAFRGCDSLTSITIGKGVTSISGYAFYACHSLTDIYFTGTEDEWAAIENIESAGLPDSVTIHYNSSNS